MKKGEGLSLILILLTFSTILILPCKSGNYGPVIPPWLSENPIERATEFLENSYQDVSTWARSSLEEYYINLNDIYSSYKERGEHESFLKSLENTFTSLRELDISINEDSLKIIDDGWEALSYIKEADLTLSDFNRYLSDSLLNYPSNKWTNPDTISLALKKIFTSEYTIKLSTLIDIAESIKSDIKNGILIGDKIFGAAIQLVEQCNVGEYDPINHILRIDLTSEQLGKVVYIWDNGVLFVDISNVPRIPIDLRAKFEPEAETGCLKIVIEDFMIDVDDLANMGIIGAFLDVKVGFSGEVKIKPDPKTSINQQIEVSLKSIHAEAGITDVLIPVKVELSYYIDEDMVLACGEAGGKPVWAHYDKTSNTWHIMKSYFKQQAKYAGYCVTETGSLSIFTIMNSNDPILRPGWNLVLLISIIGVSTAITVTIIGTMLYLRRRKHLKTNKEGNPT